MHQGNRLDRTIRAFARGAVPIAAATIVLAMAGEALACYGLTCAPTSCAIIGSQPMTHAAGPGGLGQPDDPNIIIDWGNASKNMILQSQMSLASLGAGTYSGSSLYGWVDPRTNREYAIMGRGNGTAVVDITDPVRPKYVANIPSAGSNTQWREPKVFQNHVFIGVDGGTHRLQYADLTQIPANYSGPTMTLNYATFGGSFSGQIPTNIHTLQINKDTGYLYLSGTSINSGAPLIVNVNNPAAPAAAGIVTNLDGYSHESQVVTYHGPDATYAGKEIMFTSNGKQGATADTFSIVDVTNKVTTVRLASKTYANAGYTHQGWLTEDHRYFFMNDELDESGGLTGGKTRTHLWDVSDLNNPVYKGFLDQFTTSIDHNLYVKDGFVFETNYTTGLRMFKIGNLASNNPQDWMQEVAYFDTYMPNNGATFNGAWNNYPYFPSGNIAISDINGGLFVVRPMVKGWAGFGSGGQLGSDVPEPTAAGSLLTCAIAAIARRRRA